MRLIKDNVERIADGAKAEKLMAEGFTEVNPVKEEELEQKPIGEMKADELKALAKEKGIAGAASLSKEELLEVLKDVI